MMFPQLFPSDKRIVLYVWFWFILLLSTYMIIMSEIVTKSPTRATFADRQVSSSLEALPVLSVTVPSKVTTTVQVETPMPKLTPAIYDSASIKFSRIFMPNALLGIAYTSERTKKFDALAFTQRQVQMPSNICQKYALGYGADCLQKREQYLLLDGKMGIVRQDTKLSIALGDSSSIVFTNSLEPNAGAWRNYIYVEYMPTLNQHYVKVGYYEGGNELLINAVTGETTVLPSSYPVVSPDHKRFVAASYSPEGVIDNVQIWDAQRPHLNLEADMLIENLGQQQATRITWPDTNKVQIDIADLSTQITGTLKFVLSSHGWEAYYNDQKIQAPALEPAASMRNPYIIFGVDTVAVGKRVYADREYRFKEVPDVVNGQSYILFANNNMRIAEPNYVHFTVAKPATVYIGFDMQASELPGWLDSSWQPTPDIVTTDDVVKLRLYKKNFEAGAEVTLGGNWAPPASGIRSHYLVFVTTNQTE